MATILVVDDRPTNREFLVTLLGYSGHRLLEASDGETALMLTRAERPDLIIADIVMPTMDGYELARQVRADPLIAATQIVFYTSSYTVSETRQLARACGVSHIITKPSEPQVVLDIVNDALNTRPIPVTPPVPEEFHREHMRLLTDTLARKIDELETEIAERKRVQAAEHEQRVLAESLRDTASALTSTLDLNELLGRILENVGRVVPHETANIMLIEAGVARIVRVAGYARHDAEEWALNVRVPVAEVYHLREMVAHGMPFVVQDTQTDPLWVEFPGTRWVRSYVGAPIRSQAAVIGVINAESTVPNFFPPVYGDRLLAFADQAASAIENARLTNEMRRQLGELQVLARISSALRTAQTHTEMFSLLLEQLHQLLEADSAALVTRHSADTSLVIELGRGQWSHLTGMRIPPGAGRSEHIIATREIYLTDNAQTDPEFFRPAQFDELNAAVGIPLSADDQVVGVVWIGRSAPFTRGEVHLLQAIADTAANAIYRAALYEQTTRNLRQLQSLRSIDTAITSSFDLRTTLRVLLDEVTTQLGAHAADILLLRPYLNALEYAVGRGFRVANVERLNIRLGENLAGRVVLERRALNIPHLLTSGIASPQTALLKTEEFINYYGLPLIAKGKVKGVLEIFHRTAFNLEQNWLNFAEALAGQAAIAIDNAELFDGLQRSNIDLELAYDATIEGWSKALDLRDKETEGHTQRVTESTLRLARLMNFPTDDLVHVRRGALLHDIGKMGVPDSILLKPDKLTAEEWAIMRLHPVYAYEMLSPISYLRPALDIPYCHHEKWDGAGYPRGLKGEGIPLAARIFAVVDVWDALRSDRPYRAGWPQPKIQQYIRENAGLHFDPRVVDVFLKINA